MTSVPDIFNKQPLYEQKNECWRETHTGSERTVTLTHFDAQHDSCLTVSGMPTMTLYYGTTMSTTPQ